MPGWGESGGAADVLDAGLRVATGPELLQARVEQPLAPRGDAVLGADPVVGAHGSLGCGLGHVRNVLDEADSRL